MIKSEIVYDVSLKIDSSIRPEISAALVSELEWGSQAEGSAGPLHMQHGRLKRMLGAMPWLFGSAKATIGINSQHHEIPH